jgi:hypothetical protein
MQNRWSEVGIEVACCSNGSGLQQHAEYRSDLQELASRLAEQASGRYSDVIDSNAAMGP